MTNINPKDLVFTLTHGANASAADASTPHLVSGLSDSTTAVTFPSLDVYSNISEGMGGTIEAFSTGNTGGEVVIETMATSATAKWFADRISEVKDGQKVEVYGTLINSATGLITNIRRGYILNGTTTPSYGVDGLSRLTFTIRAQDISVNTGGFISTAEE